MSEAFVAKTQLCQRQAVYLKEVTLENIQQYCYTLYYEGKFSPDYLFLSEGDYRVLLAELSKHLVVMQKGYAQLPRSEERGAKLANPASGLYMHLAPLPHLRDGEIMVIYPYE